MCISIMWIRNHSKHFSRAARPVPAKLDAPKALSPIDLANVPLGRTYKVQSLSMRLAEWCIPKLLYHHKDISGTYRYFQNSFGHK